MEVRLEVYWRSLVCNSIYCEEISNNNNNNNNNNNPLALQPIEVYDLRISAGLTSISPQTEMEDQLGERWSARRVPRLHISSCGIFSRC